MAVASALYHTTDKERAAQNQLPAKTRNDRIFNLYHTSQHHDNPTTCRLAPIEKTL